jgi:hypothetical protein
VLALLRGIGEGSLATGVPPRRGVVPADRARAIGGTCVARVDSIHFGRPRNIPKLLDGSTNYGAPRAIRESTSYQAPSSGARRARRLTQRDFPASGAATPLSAPGRCPGQSRCTWSQGHGGAAFLEFEGSGAADPPGRQPNGCQSKIMGGGRGSSRNSGLFPEYPRISGTSGKLVQRGGVHESRLRVRILHHA